MLYEQHVVELTTTPRQCVICLHSLMFWGNWILVVTLYDNAISCSGASKVAPSSTVGKSPLFSRLAFLVFARKVVGCITSGLPGDTTY